MGPLASESPPVKDVSIHDRSAPQSFSDGWSFTWKLLLRGNHDVLHRVACGSFLCVAVIMAPRTEHSAWREIYPEKKKEKPKEKKLIKKRGGAQVDAAGQMLA